jgi:MarR family transcriptional regulator, lower aerobic nicotinate degradation pathway regulator
MKRAAAPSRPEPPRAEDYVLEEQVGFLLRKAHQRASAIFAERIGRHQLTPTQFAALARLHAADGVSQNRLGRLTAMDPATMQGVVSRLVDRGFIRRDSDPADRRRAVLRLTEDGRRAFAESAVNGFAISRATLEPLAPEERAIFLALLARLG